MSKSCSRKEWMCDLQSSASIRFDKLQSLVRVWKESSSARIQGKGLDAGLSKHKISNLFSSQGELRTANVSPLIAIEKFSAVRNGKLRAEFYDDCQDISDPSALDHTQKNLLLLDD